jgi:hypothetical protein
MPGWTQSQEGRLQDLQGISMGDQQDVATGVSPFQVNDERGRSVKHCGDRFDADADLVGVRLVGRPNPGVVVGRRPFPVPEAPLAERRRQIDLRRVEVRADDFRRLPRPREVGRENEGVRRQAAGLRGLERLRVAEVREPVIAAQVVLEGTHDDAGHVRLALPVPHDAEGIREAVDTAQMAGGAIGGDQGWLPPIPIRSVPPSSPHSHAMISPAGRSRADR